MNSGNWILDNIANALNTWNEKLAEIWHLIAQSPETFKGGGIWSVVVRIHGALQAIGYALLVLPGSLRPAVTLQRLSGRRLPLRCSSALPWQKAW